MPLSTTLLRPTQFDPRKIGRLESWWDAGDASTVTLDAGRVAQWRDKSGKARHAGNNAAGSTQPDYVTAARNGRNAVRFAAASSQLLTVPNSTAAYNFLHDGTPCFVAVVVHANSGALRTVLSNASYIVNQQGFSFGYQSRILVVIGNDDSAAVLTNISAFDGTGIFGETVLVELAIDAANVTAVNRLELRRNGGAAVTGNTATGIPVTDDAIQNMKLGIADNGSPMDGDICEVLLYSTIPTAAAQATLRRYLAGKWGVALA